MTNITSASIEQYAFRALADPTRRGILTFLGQSDMSIGQLVDKFDITRAAIKKHLSILEQGKLISIHANGRERINRLEPMGLKTADDWLQNFSIFWDERLSQLKSAAEKEQQSKDENKL